jgi:hypothetical protein
LHRLEDLNNIKVNGWAKSEIGHIIKEQNTEIAWTLDSRNGHIELRMSSKLHATVDYGSLSLIPWDLWTVPAKISRKNSWRPMNSIPFEVFSMGTFVNAMISSFLN